MNISVFLGSADGRCQIYNNEAYKIGKLIASKQHTLVYGGALCGNMGATYRGCKENGGKVIVIMPQFFVERGIGAIDSDEFIITKDMDERKKLLINKCDAAIVLPGGVGTLEEMADIISLNKLKRIDKKVIIYNPNGFYDSIRILFIKMIDEGFLTEENLKNVTFVDTIEEIAELI